LDPVRLPRGVLTTRCKYGRGGPLARPASFLVVKWLSSAAGFIQSLNRAVAQIEKLGNACATEVLQ